MISEIILLVGLGNPGSEYQNNRHNVGFRIVDAIADYVQPGSSFKRIDHSVETFSFMLGKTKVILAKPMTFMNSSGRAVRFLMDFFKISEDHIYVFHDDIDLPFGRVRIKQGGGNGGHNGLKSIDNLVGKNYWRIRVGVGRPEYKTMVASYVLGDFPADQNSRFEEIIDIIKKNVSTLLSSPQKLVNDINQDKTASASSKKD